MSLRIPTPESETGGPSRLSKTTKGKTPKVQPFAKIPGIKTVQEYEQEKEQEEIYNILKNFNSLSEINKQFGSMYDSLSPRDKD